MYAYLRQIVRLRATTVCQTRRLCGTARLTIITTTDTAAAPAAEAARTAR